MSIGSVEEVFGQVRVYDESGRLLFVKSGELVGYTSSTITFRIMGQNHVYDSAGRLKYVR